MNWIEVLFTAIGPIFGAYLMSEAYRIAPCRNVYEERQLLLTVSLVGVSIWITTSTLLHMLAD